MISDQFANYFLASAGAGAALIGLLFVAISVRPEHTLGVGAHPVRQGVASGAFTALTNAFFVSMFALIPQTNVGLVALIVGVISVIITLRLGREMLLGQRSTHGKKGRRGALSRYVVTLVGSATLYAFEAFTGARLLLHSHDVGNIVGLAEILVGVYAVGLARSWELLGGPSGGISRWLNPLNDLDEPTPAPVAAPSESGVSTAEAPAPESANAPRPTS